MLSNTGYWLIVQYMSYLTNSPSAINEYRVSWPISTSMLIGSPMIIIIKTSHLIAIALNSSYFFFWQYWIGVLVYCYVTWASWRLKSSGTRGCLWSMHSSQRTSHKEFQPTAAQLSMKVELPLAKILATASRHNSKTGPINAESVSMSWRHRGWNHSLCRYVAWSTILFYI